MAEQMGDHQRIFGRPRLGRIDELTARIHALDPETN
jgi:hypothetical protein